MFHLMAIALLASLALAVRFDAHASACDSGYAPSCNNDEDDSALLQTALGVHGNPKKSETVDIKVLDVGAPRTGTQSMEEALRRLGFNPMHSGYRAPEIRPSLCEYVFGEGSFDNVLAHMGKHDVGMDEPFQFIYEEVMQRFPDSKFVLTIKDPESWWDSYYSLSHVCKDPVDFDEPEVQQNSQAWKEQYRNESWWDTCWAAKYWGCDFKHGHLDGNATKDECLKNFNAHYDRVQRVIPPERLMLFDYFKHGYEELAEFLGREVPRFPNGTVEPYPHVDRVGCRDGSDPILNILKKTLGSELR